MPYSEYRQIIEAHSPPACAIEDSRTTHQRVRFPTFPFKMPFNTQNILQKHCCASSMTRCHIMQFEFQCRKCKRANISLNSHTEKRSLWNYRAIFRVYARTWRWHTDIRQSTNIGRPFNNMEYASERYNERRLRNAMLCTAAPQILIFDMNFCQGRLEISLYRCACNKVVLRTINNPPEFAIYARQSQLKAAFKAKLRLSPPTKVVQIVALPAMGDLNLTGVLLGI